MELINGMKAVNSGLTQKDESTIASTDLVQLYATDGTPNGKISKADLMDAVKASLPALLSDQSTNGTDFLSLASGALGKMTAANLASVLGATQNYSGDLDYLVNPGVYILTTTQQHTPFGVNSWGVVIVSGNSDLFRSQLAISSGSMAVRGGLNNRADFVGASWQRCDNFGCNTLSSLASALGGALLTRHTRLTDFDLAVLKQAVTDQNLEKYGLKVGDQKTINGHDYIIAGLNCLKGAHSYTCTSNHVGLIVIPHTIQAWNASGNTSTGADNRGAGYKNCDLHYYLENTLLPLVETDLGAGNLLGHYKLLSNAVNTSGYNRYGDATGCSSGCDWEANCKICALSEAQVYGATVWSSSGFDTGEAAQQLEVFQHFNKNEIFGNEYPWLRDVVSSSDAAFVDNFGYAANGTVSDARCVAALILFH